MKNFLFNSVKLPQPRLAGSLAALVFAVSFTGLMSGCVFIPTPHYYAQGSRMNVTNQSTNLIQPGADTMEDVMLKLGEPDSVSPDERRIVYKSQKIVGQMLWLADTGNNDISQYHFLSLMLDNNGVVTNREFSKHQVSTLAGSIRGQNIKIGFPCLRCVGPYSFSGGLMLTDTTLYFADRTQWLNDKPVLCLPYEAVAECRWDDNFLGPKLLLRTMDNHEYNFEILGLGRGSRNNIQSACRLVQSNINSTQIKK